MLHNLAGDDALLSEAEDVVTENTWSVQMFRSIDINSAIQVCVCNRVPDAHAKAQAYAHAHDCVCAAGCPELRVCISGLGCC